MKFIVKGRLYCVPDSHEQAPGLPYALASHSGLLVDVAHQEDVERCQPDTGILCRSLGNVSVSRYSHASCRIKDARFGREAVKLHGIYPPLSCDTELQRQIMH